EAGAAMQAALDSNRASLGVLRPASPAPLPGAAVPPGTPSAALPPNATPEPVRAVAARAAPETAAALIGADAETVLRTLGTPRLRRTEGTSEIWLYAGPDCHLDLVLYVEGGNAARVAHAQARADSAVPRTETECLAGIARRAA
ncbi:MAG: hypothetical protein V4653_08845, partial [Pseudomonadota bacterium]